MDIKDIIYGLLAILFAGLLTFTLTPPVRVLAYKIGAVDVPTDNRRMHKKPVPRMGGLAIFISFAVAVLLFCDFDTELLGLLLGAIFMVILGMLDDVYRLNAWLKLCCQIIIACIPAFSGTTIDFFNIFGKYFVLGNAAVPVTVLWIVAVSNAVNLIDGLDGLACGVSTISAFSIMVFALIKVDYTVALLVAILAGACLGFLPYNRNPAVIFMGDTGALFLGYTLSVISIMGLFKVNAIVSFWVPFLIFGLPLADTIFATIRRAIKRQPIFSPDRGHFHHKLIDLGFTQKQTVTILYAVSGLLGISAITFAEDRIVTSVLIIICSFVVGMLNYKIFVSDSKTRNQTGLRLKNIENKNDETKE